MEKTEFRTRIEALPREEILDIIKTQNEDIWNQVRRIEYVFEKKLTHLAWRDGSQINGRPLSNEELSMLVDEPFAPKPELSKLGISIADQEQIHVAQDPVLWSRQFLKAKPRAYQILILRWPGTRKVLRAGRRLGKTYTMSLILLHYSWTHKDGKCIVVAPMKSQAELIYREIMKLAKNSDVVNGSITRSVSSPQYEIVFSNGSSIKFFTSGIRCLTPDHDVLTYNGWKSIADVVAGEKVLSWSDGQLLWSTAEAVWSYDYEGPLLEHKGRQLSFRATPNHKWRVRSGNGTKYRWVDATELKNDQVIPGSGTPTEWETENYTADEMELWGWWLSEGSGFIGNAARFTQKKQPGLDRIVQLAKNLGYNPQVYTYGDKASEIRVLGWKPPLFSGNNSLDKFIPRELLNERYRSSLLMGLLGGDGWIRTKGWEYSSSSYQLINNVQELAVLEGFRTLLKEKNITYIPVDGGDVNRHWIVSAYPYDGWTVTRQKDRMSWEPYKGKVHCLTVPETGTFVVRHNGAVHITGNSGGKADVVRGQEAHIIVLDELDYMHVDDLESLYAMLQKTDENQPDKQLIGASTPTGQRSMFWKWCFLPDTQVMLGDGRKQIQDIVVGDTILNGYGAIESVSDVFTHSYDGRIVSLDIRYGPPLTSTEDHPHIVLRGGVEDFIDAKDVVVGDSIKIPFRPCRSSDINNNLSQYLNTYPDYCDKALEMLNAGVSKTQIVSELSVAKTTLANKLNRYKANNSFADPRRIETVRQAKILYTKICNMSDITALGLYLAEGHISKEKNWLKGVVWTFHSDESNLIDICSKFLLDLDIQPIIRDRTNVDSTIQVLGWGTAIGLLFQSMFGEKENKRVPSFVDSSDTDIQQTFINGVYLGDGTTDGTALTLTAQDAIVDLFYIFLRNKTLASIHLHKRELKRDCMNLDLPRGKYSVTWGDNCVYYPITRKTITTYEGPVHNFETKDTHTYTAEIYGTHNCTNADGKSRFKEFWFPSYVNPYFTKEDENEFRLQYSEMGYRHEIEADWGEDVDGVYPRRYVDIAFKDPGWDYICDRTSARSFHVMGVDWDKYGAGTNIVILEVCDENYEIPEFRGKIRLAYREETIKEEYSLTKAVNRIIELNQIFDLRHIYVDRGFGEVQIELLHKYGVDHPESGLRKRVVGVSSSETLEMRDPASKQLVKKDIKPFMVDNLRQFLEAETIVFPRNDEDKFKGGKSLYLQLISYVVLRTTQTGRPVFEAGGEAEDHAHDALMLAAFAITQNYGDLMKLKLARHARPISNETFLPMFELSDNELERDLEEKLIQKKWGDAGKAPVQKKRALTVNMNRRNVSRPIARRSF